MNQAEFIYKWTNNVDNYHNIFPNYFKKQEDIHNYNTRYRKNYRPPKFSNKYGKQSMAYTGAKIWNALEDEVKKSKSHKELKSKLKKILFQSYN